ncbi:MAG: DUF4157 domain-containing protein [Paracoccaceae bacterium]
MTSTRTHAPTTDRPCTDAQAGREGAGVRLGPEHDLFEQQAERAASKIALGDGVAGMSFGAPGSADAALRPKTGQSRNTTHEAAAPAAAVAVSKGGRSLSAGERAYFEPRFGRDLGHVRLHTDAPAARAAHGIGARAYTYGSHVGFAEGQFSTATQMGRQLIAHELVHTLQNANQMEAEAPVIRRDAVPGEVAPAPPAPPVVDGIERGDTQEMDFAFVFTGGAFGNAAEAFIDSYYPEYELIQARSFEAMFDRLYREMRSARAQGRDPHLRELVIVTHANAAGGLQIPLTRSTGRRPEGFFNIWSLAELQDDFRNDLHQRFRQRRREVVSDMFDESTRVIVRGCEFGQAPEALDALRTFFGGDAYVWAPTGFQGFETLRIGGERLPTPEAAFDFLAEQEYLPPELQPMEEESKREYIARVFGLNGTVPATFFVMGREDYTELRRLMAQREGRGLEAEDLKDREDNLEPTTGEHWESSAPGALGRPIPELDALSADELEARGRALMQNYRPQIAYMLERLRNAWERKGMETLDRCEDTNDPLCGLPPEDAFGDPNITGTDANRFPGPNIDAFETTDIQVPEEQADTTQFEESLAPGGSEATPINGTGPNNAEMPRPARSGQEEDGGSTGPGNTPSGSALSGRAAAQDFDKSQGLSERQPQPEPEPEPIDPQAIIDAMTNEADREAAQAILDRLPTEGWTLSNYLSAAELSVNVAAAPLTFVEGVAATFALEAGAVVLGGVLSIVGFLVTIEESREAQAEAAQALGVELGYERLIGQLSGDRITGEADASEMRDGLTDDYRVVSQIRYNIPHGGRTALPNIEIGVNAVAHDANRVLEAADRTLRQRLVEGGLTGSDLDRVFEAARPIIRRRFIDQMMRQGGQAIARRRELLEQRQ